MSDRLHVVQGDARNAESLERAVQRQDAVLSSPAAFMVAQLSDDT